MRCEFELPQWSGLMSSMSILAKTFIAVIIAATMISCSDSSKKSSANLIDAKPSGGSCDFTANDGDHANMELLGEEDVQIASFAKPFNEAYLQAVLTTSIEESLKFINQTGVNIFRVPSDNSGCNAIAAATNITDDLQLKWNALTKDDSKKNQFTLGVYLPKKSENIEALDDKAAILVRENTNRWTVVHEFMHHLFMIELEKAGHTDESIRENANRDWTAFTNLADNLKIGSDQINLNAQEQKRLEDAFRKTTVSMDIFVKSFYLEEMTIEKRLHDLYNNGTLKFVPQYAYDSGIGYINGSAENAKVFYEMLDNYATTMASYKIGGSNTELIKVSESANLIRSRLNEITMIVNQYPARQLKDLDSEQLRYRAKNSKNADAQFSCPREKLAEDLLQKMKKRQNRSKSKGRLSLQSKPH